MIFLIKWPLRKIILFAFNLPETDSNAVWYVEWYVEWYVVKSIFINHDAKQ